MDGFGARYQEGLGSHYSFLDDSLAICESLRGKVKQYVITNGVTSTQRKKLELSGLWDVMDGIFISEEIGASKPDPAFFRAVFGAMGLEDLRRVLMVGDNLLADVKGGLDAGVDAVWYNPRRLPPQGEIVPTYDLGSFQELEALILG